MIITQQMVVNKTLKENVELYNFDDSWLKKSLDTFNLLLSDEQIKHGVVP